MAASQPPGPPTGPNPTGQPVMTDPNDLASMPPMEGEDMPTKRKATSFKITNVFLSRPPSNDGDDSCEDGEELEDSRTEDLSDITDANSLNSLSSKLESLDFVNNPVIVNGGQLKGTGVNQQGNQPLPGASASSKPPVVPSKPKTSPSQPAKENQGGWKPNALEQRRPSWDKTWEPPQYAHPYGHPGFGFVTYETGLGGAEPYPVSYVDKATGYIPVAGTMAVINNVVSGGVSEVPVSSQAVAGPHDFRLRFKIVKVETTEPLKRGRWTCLDFNDKPAVKEKEEKIVAQENSPSSGKTVSTSSGALPTNPEQEQSRSGGLQIEGREGRLPGQTEPLLQAQPFPPASEPEKMGGETAQQQPRLPSLPPEERRPASVVHQPLQQQAAAYTPGISMAAQTPTTSTPSLSIALPPQSSSLTTSIAQQVQSPGAQLIRTDFPQATIGQVVRLSNGELAQVSLTPLGSGSGTPGSGGVGSTSQAPFPAQQQQQPPVVLKPIPTKQPPPAQPQPQQQPPTQQQVVVNAAGQQFLVAQGGAGVQQQQANQPAATAAGRGQALQQQQPGLVSRPQQQPAVKLVGQQAPSQPAPSQQQQQHQLLQKQFSPSGGGPHTAGPTPPAPSMQQSVTPSSSSSSSSSVLLNSLPPTTMVAPTVHSSSSSVATIARTTSGGAAVRLAAPIPSSVIGSSSLPSVTTVASVTSAVKYPVSSGGQAAFLPALPSYSREGAGPGQENLVGEGLVERLEDLVTRGEEEGKETQWGGELEHESASGAGQGSIDNRIEQAMDLVKSHLMSAVRSEVEELREKIAKLEDTVQVLSRENDTLRNHVAPEVLNQLPNPAQRGLLGPQHLNSLPPPEPAHPALQPPQH